MSVAVGGKYTGTIRLRNFEVWHLGLIAFVLRDLKEGRLTFGTASSRGLGQMRGELLDASIRVFSPDAAPGKIVGLGILTGTAWSAYGFASLPAEKEGIPAGVPPTDDGMGIGQTYEYKGDEQVLSLLRAAAPVWGEYIRARAAGGN